MESLITLLTQYWGIGAAAVFGVGYVLAHRSASIAYVRGIVKTFIVAAEKRAETLVLATGAAKLAWVVDHGYDLLPGVVRMVVSKPLFAAIVQHEYDVAVSWAEKHVVADSAPTV